MRIMVVSVALVACVLCCTKTQYDFHEFKKSYQGTILEHRCEVVEASENEVIIKDLADENLFAVDPDNELVAGDGIDVLFADHATENRTDDEIICYYKAD